MVLVFHLNVLIHVLISGLLILDKVVQTLIDSLLECVLVINVLNDFMTSILEVLNDHVIVPNQVAADADSVSNLGLSHSQVLNHETQTRVDLVVLLQALIHLLGLVSQVFDFELLGSDVSPQILNLLV